LIVVVVWLPLPLRTRAEGVIWVPDEAHVRARTDGLIERVVARPGATVRRGDVLIICRDPQLTAQVKELEFRLEELQTRYAAQWLEDIHQAQIIKEEMSHVEERVARARERLADLIVRSRADGVFIVPQAENLPGRFVQQGAKLGYVLNFAALTARVVVPQADVDLVRHRSKKVELRLADRVSESLPAVMVREVPAASEDLPSTALGTQGGGSVAVDPGDQRGLKAIQKLFQFELGLPTNVGIKTLGGRVYVRFDHGWEPLMSRWIRQLRQLFLAKFDGVYGCRAARRAKNAI
jgi:putative peptide zinc metalloprotease protein